ncbi:hypothetical protein [Streptomyces albiflavescens]|uniref:hypothetical protein n=1 Tax=Streptomyces albiflavescens TaxID=1623582 RepID=UPI001E375834|nr:hypothetical protein [Streptomyces albiflavescens]
MTIAIAAVRLECWHTRWSATAELRLRYTRVDLTRSVFDTPVTVASARPFTDDQGIRLDETAITRPAPWRRDTAQIIDLHGVDAAHLVLSDVDLSSCEFTGAVHLDQLRLEGDCPFAVTPPGIHWRRWRPVRFSQRSTLAEEQGWRARRPRAVSGWREWPGGRGTGPAQLAPMYRALRKSFEDSKNEPGAADFYYGEMEMRRHNPRTPRAERSLLAGYWALSGYGLRATRALVWLLLAMTATLLGMMLWGLPSQTPQPVSTGDIHGHSIRLTTDTPDPVNPGGSLHERISTARFEKGLRVVVNSVIFRSSGQDLTTAGTYTEMASRLTEPVLLGLAVLAIRNRVKR